MTEETDRSALKYQVVLNLADVHDSRALAIGRVGARSRVLDVGIGDGTVGRALREMDCRVFGIENDKELADVSRDDYEELVVGDVESLDLAELFDEKFDVILLLDVLEHLRAPGVVLERMRDLLAENGYVVISLPNVAHAAVKLQLIGGAFSYTDEGLLDSTHLRFFDFENVQALLAEAHFEMFDLARVKRMVDATEIPVDLETIDPGVLEAALADPESETYQFIVTAAPSGSAALEHPPLLPAKLLQDEIASLHDEVAALKLAGGRPWLNRITMNWVEEQLNLLHQREQARQQELSGLVNQYRDTVDEIRRRLLELM
jgi:2-polyprenyl-3-methyl-5-hydroxy-6-metoxy-1,4-benzoquinol methylase